MSNQNKQFFVYTHARPDGSIFYVGKGISYRASIVDRKHNPYHTNIVAKYGKENIIVKTMLCRDEQHAFDLETKMITALRNGGVKLANIANGGSGASGIKHSIESKNKLSIYAKNRSESTRKKMSDSAKLRGFTDEQRRKMRESRIGLIMPEKTRIALAKANIGRKMSAESRRKTSEWRKKFYSESIENLYAQPIRKDNKTGVKGVSFDKSKGLFVAQLNYKNKTIFKACFVNLDDAIVARTNAFNNLMAQVQS